ncbi:MAG: OprD family outer membrane porin [Campylobacterota bacterium]|nr:OprD family outer membrane porin [Campylobacterota bacterium]
MIDIMSGMLLASAAPQEGGLMHTKQAGRYETVKELPKESNSFNQMFDYANVTGNVRATYMYNNLRVDDNSAFAIGGTFGFDTASYRGFNLHVKATTSQNINALNSDAASSKLAYDLFDENGESFTYLSHANLHYTNDILEMMAGRILIDTPYADSDDIRMAANTFEGLHVNSSLNEKVDIQGCYLTRWAGYDSGENQQEFKSLVDGGFGVAGASLNYKIDEENIASLWYYYVDDMSSIIYAEYAGHHYFTDEFHMEFGIQGSSIGELDDSSISGNVLGAMALLDYGPFFGGFSYNYGYIDEGKMITDGFGGGPYYTSLDEATIGAVSEAAMGQDVEAYRLGAGYDLESQNIVFEMVYGNLSSSDNRVNIDEFDVVVTYEIDDRWSVEGIFMKYTSKDPKEEFDRGLLRVDYHF